MIQQIVAHKTRRLRSRLKTIPATRRQIILIVIQQIPKRRRLFFVEQFHALLLLKKPLRYKQVRLFEPPSLSIRTLGLVENIKIKRRIRIVAEASLMGHILDQLRPLLLHIIGLYAFILQPLQIQLSDLGVHGHHLIRHARRENIQVLGEPIELLQKLLEYQMGLFVDLDHLFVVVLLELSGQVERVLLSCMRTARVRFSTAALHK